MTSNTPYLARRAVVGLLLRPVRIIGSATLETLEFIGGVGFLVWDTSLAIRRGLITGRGRRLGWRSLWEQMVRVGVKSVPIVVLVLFCIGAILALSDLADPERLRGRRPHRGHYLDRHLPGTGAAGGWSRPHRLRGRQHCRRTWHMVVSEEIEALEAEAISPVRFLVLPRILATVVMMVCVSVIANLSGVWGGMVVSRYMLGITPRQYLNHTFAAIQVRDFVTGLIKAGVFGGLISSLACYLGLNVTGGAQGVGVATTRTVVLTIVAVILVDLMFTTVFYALKL